MSQRTTIVGILFLSLIVLQVGGAHPNLRGDSFHAFISDLGTQLPREYSGIYTVPSEDDLKTWNAIFSLFRMKKYDSCKALLRKFDYTLFSLTDSKSGNVYQIIREQLPIHRGWGTFVYNPGFSKRLNIDINHPVDDGYVLQFGAEFFRRSNAEWLLIGGTSRNALAVRGAADAGKLRRSVYERWHELTSDLTHISLSIHGFDETTYPFPIRMSDCIVSNGKTSDEQWGISQISLGFRDTLRRAGYHCGLAMYDSGYARLAGGWNIQGVFSNDSLGFGHWLYLELSGALRSQPVLYEPLMTALDHALDITGKRISQQVNRAFGLVSPRVVRVDSLHRMLFPPPSFETYRIISFNTTNSRNDTIDVRLGDWMDFMGSRKSMASVTRMDTGKGSVDRNGIPLPQRDPESVLAKISDAGEAILPSVRKFARSQHADSLVGEDERNAEEPLQVHRIPLQPVLATTFSFASLAPSATTFRWNGEIASGFNPRIPTFQMSRSEEVSEAAVSRSFPKFLIPLISSYHSADGKYVGIQMTEILVKEIARLVTEHREAGKDIGLLAEQGDEGNFYLRIFPSSAKSR
ncbi:MAG TPA: hypothetical protein VLY03_03625 [Bacteroidota bacterium]|nr:hypothetical protein [Bacteroidota bacterium]